ncbi:MAG: response regulator [Pseudomonadota bacterium]
MIALFSQLKLERKVQVLIVSAASLALLCACLLVLVGQTMEARSELTDRLDTLSEVIASNSVGALSFEDDEQAERVLSSLLAQSSVTFAALYTNETKALAEYVRSANRSEAIADPGGWLHRLLADPSPGENTTRYSWHAVELVHPVVFDGEHIGTLYLRSTLAPIIQGVLRSTVLIALALTAGTVAALFLASVLSPALIAPLMQLSQMAQSVSRDNDFSLRAQVKGNDEIAALAHAVNEMLRQLELRDQRLAAHRERLEAEVVERTQRLADTNGRLESLVEELRAARDRAQAASTAKSDFLARMSHEIRTPMNGVLGMTELLLSSELEPRQRRYADSIHHSAEALLSIINDILDFSKIEAGKMELDHAPFDLREAIEDVAELLCERADSKGVELLCDIPTDLRVQRVGDAARIRQVLINLVGNAVKFTEQGEVVVRVFAIQHEGDEQLRIEVSDTGIGISSESLTKVFDSFSQEDGTVTRRFGGTGLGLTISRQLVELMGGEIGCRSQVGRGSTFWFHIPLACATQSTELQRDRLTGARALIVDDNASNREILHRQLSAWGMEVLSARDGEGALSAVRKASDDPFDIVLMDLQLPDRNGIDITESLRVVPGGDIPSVILLSSISGHVRAEDRLRVGIEATLTKPLRQHQLLDCLVGLLQGNEGSARYRASSARQDARAIGEIGARVLLVEDNEVNQAVALGMLAQIGCTAQCANNGREAVEMLEASWDSVDVVLMDCQMPIMDGFSATQALRNIEALESRTPLPIIALTANAMEGDREKCAAAGMSDYLSKPFTLNQLREVLLRQRKTPTTEGLPQPALDARATLDTSVLAALSALPVSGAEGTLMERVVKLYAESSPALLERLINANSFDEARSTAHALRSSSANVGAQRVSALCEQLEALPAEAESDAQWRAMVEQISREHGEALRSLNAFLLPRDQRDSA